MENLRGPIPAWTVDCAEVDGQEDLTACLRAIATRSGEGDVTVVFKNLPALSPAAANCMLCVLSRTLVTGGRHVPLPRREFEVALVLATHDGPVSRHLLGSLLRPSTSRDVASTFAKVYVSRLRKRLAGDGLAIERNFSGYYLSQPVPIDLDFIEAELTSLGGVPLPQHLASLHGRLRAILESDASLPAYATIRHRLLRIERALTAAAVPAAHPLHPGIAGTSS